MDLYTHQDKGVIVREAWIEDWLAKKIGLIS